MRTHRRSRRRQNQIAIENLESRELLTGVVTVSAEGADLVVTGDRASNEVTIDLTATSVRNAIQGRSGTQVNVTSAAAQLDLDAIQDLRIQMGRGNDNVVVDMTGRELLDDLWASLGMGNDVMNVVGASGTVRDNALIYGRQGNDSVTLSGVTIGDDLRVYGGADNDLIATSAVTVVDQTNLSGETENDAVIIRNSNFQAFAATGAGIGDDLVTVVGSQFDALTLKGGTGRDALSLADSDVDGEFDATSFETLLGTQAAERNTMALEPAIAGMFAAVTELEGKTADRLHDTYRVLTKGLGVDLIELNLDTQTQTVAVNDPTPSVSVLWDRVVQEAVASTSPGPTIGSRAYAMMHTAMYDAWSAYDSKAISTQRADDLQRPSGENTAENKIKAMSFAAYRVLRDLFPSEIPRFNALMDEFGYNPGNNSTDPTTATGIGNTMAAELLQFRHADGSNQLGDDPDGDSSPYSDTSGYVPVNNPGDSQFIDAWTPEYVPIDSQPGDEDRIQQFLTPHWGEVTPFALRSGGEYRPVAPEPFLMVDGATYDLDLQTITLADNTVLNIDPSLVGTVINPAFIEQAEEVVDYSANLTDEHKMIAEFWEDGGGTSFPPGTFMTFGQFVSARDNNSINEDAKLFFAMSNAVFDAGVATWEAKEHYNYARPVRVIRDLGELGLIGEFDADLGGHAIDAWTPDNGTQRILATEFLTYQTPGSDPSPPFAEYTSGHSAFSAAGAKILSLFTGSDDFGGSVTFPAGSSRFEAGTTPTAEVTLSWDTFTEAADEAGLSRLYGGIHFDEGDINGRRLGEDVAGSVWDRVQRLVNGG